MSAKLVALKFDRKTEEYLCRERADDQSAQATLDEMQTFGDLSASPVLLKNLPAGDYILLLSAEYDREPATSMHLLKAQSGEVMHTARLDLSPLMQSAIDDGPEFNTLMMDLQDSDSDEALQAAADEKLSKLVESRATALEGILSPYIQNDQFFNVELLDILDYMTYPLIKNQVSDDIELDEAPELSPLHAYKDPTLH